MSPEERATLGQILRDRRALLIEAGDVPFEQTRAGATQAGVDDDQQPHIEMSQALASNRNRVRGQELQLIDEALLRLKIDPEMFGHCEVCEEPIAAQRLLAMPHARMCVRCQSKVEDPVRRARRKITDYV